MFDKTRLASAIALIVATTQGVLSAAVHAQNTADQNLVIEEVYITGSRIKRSDVTSAAPITVLSSQNLMDAGTPTIENFLQDLPSISGGDYGSGVNNGNDGWATASLRGLGPVRTLVLINGRRPASAGPEGFVDLNTIPTSIVDRIEVLRDGASTIYGSDAIAGVINIITKKQFEGLDVDIQYDVAGEGDGESYLASLTFGTTFDRGSLLLNAQYTKRADIWQGDRKFSECPLIEDNGTTICSGSGTSYPARISAGTAKLIVDPSTGQLRAFTPSDAFNYAAVSYLVTPQEVYSLFGSADYDIVESGAFTTITAFTELSFANRVSDQLMAPVGTFWGAEVGADHPNNPLGNSRTDGGTPQSVVITRRLAETGGRSYNQDATSWGAVFGLKGEFENGWAWDTSFRYSRYVDTQVVYGQINKPRVETLLDPTDCAADNDCPGVWNPFSRDTLTKAMQDYALVTHSPVLKSRMLQTQVNVSGDFGSFELPSGKPAWAVGYERRAEEASETPDGAAALDQIYFVASAGLDGSYSVDEFYAELSVPVLSDVVMAKELTVDVSGRYSDYSFLDDTNDTYKFGINWAPTEDIRVRYTFAEGFRAPNIDERFSPASLTAAQYNEPCLNYGAGASAVVEANCVADGLPPDFKLTSNQATGTVIGNPELEPETSESQTIGLVITPAVLPNFTATLDYFNIEIEDAIGTIGTDGIITGCYNSPNFTSPMCSYLKGPASVGDSPHPVSPYRDVLGAISGQLLINENLATFETTGVDFDFTYIIDADFAQIELKWFGTWLDSYEYLPFKGGELIDLAGKFGTDPYQGDNAAAFPEWKSNLRVTLDRENWRASWTARYMSETQDSNADASNLENYADAIWYHDVQGSYILGNVTMTAGVRNLLDEEPPYVTNNTDMNTLNFSYDTAGRYFYTRVGFSF